jgi:hypothetical protein
MSDAQSNAQNYRVDSATKVAMALTEPRSFLLFLFCVLALFEIMSWRKATEYSHILITVIDRVEANRTREMAANQEMIRSLLNIITEHDRAVQSADVIRRNDYPVSPSQYVPSLMLEPPMLQPPDANHHRELDIVEDHY